MAWTSPRCIRPLFLESALHLILKKKKVDAALARPFPPGPFVFPDGVQRRRRDVRLHGTNSSAATYAHLSTNAYETVI
jgi:hypothetical protein